MSDSIQLQVVRFPVPANGDLTTHIDQLEEYEQVITGWDRTDIAVPTFEQWAYITHRSDKLRDRQKEQSRGEIQFAAIESLVLQLEKCNLALVRKQSADSHNNANSGYEVLKLSLELSQQLNLAQRYQKRLNELFDYYVIDCASAIHWEQFGQVPQAQVGMR
ncbi:hypothetical protein ACO0LB_17035 [Undibacterium sp. SXout7W]|uniref:hypothetical protein n=1 Tax=Undibacterium sp. SXout7W TaxID=3413049 RepID=UPI003BF24110